MTRGHRGSLYLRCRAFSSLSSHRFIPAHLQVGRTPVERPWERMAWEGVITPTAAEMDVADAAIIATRQRFGRYPTYARVDIIAGPTGTPTVLEIELIDPYLSLDM